MTSLANLCIGIDLGTSGVRAVAVDEQGQPVASAQVELPAPQREGARITQDPQLWWQAVEQALFELLGKIEPGRVAAIAVDGTSGTLLLTDARGTPLSRGWMYNDSSCTAQATRIAQVAPEGSAAHGASSPLARLLYLQAEHPQAAHALHQADWIAARLSGRYGISDDNNVLKLGYDVVRRCWPDWFDVLNVRRELLPQVLPPGSAIGQIDAQQAQHFDLSPQVFIATGTTDGVAAFLATGADQVGDAVTSLGSTLVIKLLCDRPLFAPRYGIYSHRLGQRWLAGGASNSGGAALLAFFTPAQMQALEPALQPEHSLGLGYYPLSGQGERFPLVDAQMQSRTEPRPSSDAQFFQALLEGVAGVERLAFERLTELGAPALARVFSVGGGARNAGFTRIRERTLGVPVLRSAHDDAAFGVARLARKVLA